MRRSMLAVLAGLLLATGAVCGAEVKDTGRVFMWEAASDTSTVYILGTIHFLSDDMYPLDGAIEKAFRESGTLVMEMAASQANMMKAAGLAMQEGMYQGEATLSKSISAQTMAKLEAHLKERGMSAAAFDKMKPWLVTMTLAVVELQKLGFRADQGIDMHYYQKAVERSMPVWDLETPEYQIKLVSDGTAEEQELELAEMIEDAAKTAEILKALTDGWKAGDPEAINRVLVENRSENALLQAREDRLIYDRNVHMVEKIEQMLKLPGKYFVMVGSAHLVSEKGIVKALEGKGHKVRQVERTVVQQPMEAPAAQ